MSNNNMQYGCVIAYNNNRIAIVNIAIIIALAVSSFGDIDPCLAGFPYMFDPIDNLTSSSHTKRFMVSHYT